MEFLFIGMILLVLFLIFAFCVGCVLGVFNEAVIKPLNNKHEAKRDKLND